MDSINDLALIFLFSSSDIQCKDEIVKSLSGASYSTRSSLINAKGANNLTPLILSATNRYIETATYLIDKGANKDDCDDDGNAALHIACQNGDDRLVILLLDKSVNPNLKNKNGLTPLLLAALCQHKHVIQIFKEKKLKVKELKDNELNLEYKYHRKLLNNIIFDEKNELEKNLQYNLENNNNVDINIKLPIGDDMTLLMVCAVLDHSDCLELLIKYKAKVDIIDKYGRSALFRASGRGNIKSVRLLLKENADVNLSSGIIDHDNGNLTPLMAAVIGNNTVSEVVSALLENKADVTCVNSHKETVLHMAVKNYAEACIKIIVPYCIDNGVINAVDDNEDTCLHVAARCNCSKTIIEDLLVTKDRDIANDPTEKEKRNSQGETALIIASRIGNIDVVYALLDNGVNILTKGEKKYKGFTCLMAASGEGNWEIVHLICDRIKIAQNSVVLKMQNSDDNDIKTFINSKLPNNECNALHLAIKGAAKNRGNSNAYLNCIRLLIESGIDVDATNKIEETALIMAVREGLVDAVNVLLDRKSKDLDHFVANSNLITDTFSNVHDSVYFKNVVAALNCAVKIEGRQDVIKLIIDVADNKFPVSPQGDKAYRNEPIKVALLSRRLEYLWDSNDKELLWYDKWVEGEAHVKLYKAVLKNDLKFIDSSTNGQINDIPSTHVTDIKSSKSSINGKQSSLSKKSSFRRKKDDDNKTYMNMIQQNLEYYEGLEMKDIGFDVQNFDITKNIADAMRLGFDKKWYEARDKTGSTILLWTASLGYYDLAKLIIERCAGIDINVQHTETQSTPLILAAKYGHLSILKLMVENNALKEFPNANNRTALALAARKNQLECVKYLIKEGHSMLEMKDMLGRTPLLNAIKPHSKDIHVNNVSFEVVDCILRNKADVSVRDFEGKTALTHAIEYRNETIDIDVDKEKANQRKIMSLIELLLLYNAKDSDGKVPSDVITTEILFINSSVLNSSRDPLSIIHKFYKKNVEDDTIPVVTQLESIIHDRRLLERIFTFQYSLYKAASNHIFDSHALREKADEIDLILDEIFMSELLEHDHNVIQLLLPSLAMTEYNCDKELLDCNILSKEEKNEYLRRFGKKYKPYFKKLKSNNKTFEVDKMQIRRKIKRFLKLNYAHSIKCRGGVLFSCINHDLKTIFNFPKVSNILQNVLYVTLSPREPKDSGYISFNLNNFELDFRSEIERLNMFRNLRYCPIMMCMFDMISKFFTLLVIAYLCTTSGGEDTYVYEASILLKLLTLGQLLTGLIPLSSLSSSSLLSLYTEYGQLHDQKFSFFDHFDDWNCIDACAAMLLVTWAIINLQNNEYFFNYIDDGSEVFYLEAAKVVLSVAAIPQSLSLLQYASLSKATGELVIMIKGMAYDVFPFLVIYLVSTVGLAITFNGLFSYQDPDSAYGSIGNAILSLYAATLGGFDFAVEGSKFDTINDLGVAFLTVHVLFSSVLLLNLLVACMSATYQRIADKSMQEWSFFIAKTVQQFILINEKSPFSILPAPFNIITSALSPLHYIVLWTTNISLAGTVADFLLYMLGVFLCVPYIYYVTFQKIPFIYMKIFSNLQVTAKIYWQSRKRENRYILIKEFFVSLYFVFVFPLTFPIYMVFMNLIYVNDSNLVKVKNGIIQGLETISSTTSDSDNVDSQDIIINDGTKSEIFVESDVTRILEVMRKKETIDSKLDVLIEEIGCIRRQLDKGNTDSISEMATIADGNIDQPVAVSSALDYINPFSVVGSLFRPLTQRDLLLSGTNDDVKTLMEDLKRIVKKLDQR